MDGKTFIRFSDLSDMKIYSAHQEYSTRLRLVEYFMARLNKSSYQTPHLK